MPTHAETIAAIRAIIERCEHILATLQQATGLRGEINTYFQHSLEGTFDGLAIDQLREAADTGLREAEQSVQRLRT